MHSFSGNQRLISAPHICIVLFTIIAGCNIILAVADHSKMEDCLSNREIKTISFLGEESLSDQRGKSGKKKQQQPIKDNLPDTILPFDHIRLKLEDPDYDVRYEKGSIKPWHEIKSIYLKRQISPSNFAAIPSHYVC